ncbi:MAG: MDR family MFS transporter [Nocardioidaceae bacterium]|nr:MDR family MFS transporter [Nocardioidaceae bacterium]
MSTPTTAPPPAKLSRENTVVLGLLLVSAFVVILNETIMSVALPRLMTDLSITAGTAQWLTSGFLLTMAVVIPATGLLLQRFTLRAVFIAAMSLFSVGTLLAATAPGFEMLLVGRIVQAGGTAVMIPLLMTTVLSIVPAEGRGRMMGRISIIIAVAPAIGPTVSGLILQVFSWRAMFWLVLPIALLSLALGAAKITNVTQTRKVGVDVLSIILSALAFGGLIYGLSSIGEAAAGDVAVPVWVPLTVGVVSLALFVWRQLSLQRRDAALLDLRTFATPAFRTAAVLMSVTMLALFGSLVLLPIYLQDVLGLSTLTTGLMLLPGGLVMGLLAPLVGRTFDRVGPRPLVIPGAVLLSAALWLMTTLDAGTVVITVIGIHVLLSIGIAMMLTPLLTSALGSLRQSLYSHGSAVVGTVQQLAGATGTALFVTVMTTRAASQAEAGASAVAATASGVQTAFLCGAVVSLLAIGLSFLVRRTGSAPADAEREPVHA